PGVHTGGGQAADAPAAGGEGGHLGLGDVTLRRLLAQPLGAGEDDGAEGGGDEQDTGDLHRQDVVGEQQPGHAHRVGVGVGLLQAAGGGHGGAQGDGDDEGHEAGTAEDPDPPLPLERLDHRVGGVHADEHEDEEEEHHDRAGVDDDLGHPQEDRLLDDVEPGQGDHDEDDAHRGVDGLAGEEEPEGG